MTTKQNKKSNILSFAVMLFIIGVTLYLIFSKYTVSDIFAILKTVKPIYLALALLFMIVYVVLEGISHRTITRSLGEKTSYRKGIVYSSVDLFFSAITPSSEGGQPLMIYTMSRDGISISRSTVTAVLFTNMFTSGLLICTAVAAILRPDLLFTDNIWFRLGLIFGLTVSFVIFIGCFLLLRFGQKLRPIGVGLIGFFRKLHIVKHEEKALHKLDDAITDFTACSDYIKSHPLLTAKVLCLATLQRIIYFSVPYCVYLAFGLSGTGFFDLFAIQVITQISVYALPIPGAAGVTDAMMLMMYQDIYPGDMAAAAMLLVRALTFYFTVIFCGGITLTDSIFHKRKKHKEALTS